MPFFIKMGCGFWVSSCGSGCKQTSYGFFLSSFTAQQQQKNKRRRRRGGGSGCSEAAEDCADNGRRRRQSLGGVVVEFKIEKEREGERDVDDGDQNGEWWRLEEVVVVPES